MTITIGAVGEPASTDELPSVAVVVPTFDRRDRLEATLAPLLDDPATAEIVVVLDGSTDDSLDLLRRRAAQDARVRPVAVEHRGASAARQAGVEAARSDVVLMLDDDLVAEPGLVTGHARRHAAERGLVVIGYADPGHGERRRGSFPDEIYADAYRTSWESYAHDPEQALLHLWGGNVSLRLDDCLRVGVHSPDFHCRYHEDADFGARCLKAGLRAVADCSLRARHVHTRSLDGFLRDAFDDGAGMMLLHVLHADLVGPPAVSRFAADLPPGLGQIVRLCRRRPVERVTTRVLRAAVNVAGRLRMFQLEANIARLLRRVHQQRGALELLAADPPLR